MLDMRERIKYKCLVFTLPRGASAVQLTWVRSGGFVGPVMHTGFREAGQKRQSRPWRTQGHQRGIGRLNPAREVNSPGDSPP